jgi:hypothetical protein
VLGATPYTKWSDVVQDEDKDLSRDRSYVNIDGMNSCLVGRMKVWKRLVASSYAYLHVLLASNP